MRISAAAAVLVAGLWLPLEVSAESSGRAVSGRTTILGTVVPDDAACPVAGTLVYVPGRSSVVKLGADGHFAVPDAPVDADLLRIEVPALPALDIALQVNDGVTDVGVLAVPGTCESADPPS